MSEASKSNGTANGAAYLRLDSEQDRRQFAEESVREMLGLTPEEAFVRLDAGDYRGSIVEVELNALRQMLGC